MTTAQGIIGFVAVAFAGLCLVVLLAWMCFYDAGDR